MRRLVSLAALVGLATIAATRAPLAQEMQAEGGFHFRSPVFLFMPGGLTVNAISAPDGLESATGFNLRFQTTIPTTTPWFTPVFGVQWQPNGLDGNDNNAPTVYYGFVVPLIQSVWTGGWLDVSIDPLGVFALGNGGRSAGQPYGHDFFLELAVSVPIGSKMMRTMGQFSKLSLFLLADQQITHPPRDVGGDRDYFRPVLIYGLALPLAPWGSP